MPEEKKTDASEKKEKKYEFMEYASLIVNGNPTQAGARALIAIAEELRRLNENIEKKEIEDHPLYDLISK